LLFLGRFSYESAVSNFAEIHRVGAQLIHTERMTDGRTRRQTDRQTDMRKLIGGFGD